MLRILGRYDRIENPYDFSIQNSTVVFFVCVFVSVHFSNIFADGHITFVYTDTVRRQVLAPLSNARHALSFFGWVAMAIIPSRHPTYMKDKHIHASSIYSCE